jgi:putative phosphonate metabolism protein
MPAEGRYALFFTPAEGSPLAAFGRRWLEREPEDAARMVGGALSPEEAARFTAAPRRYGFHATLKAPFAVPPGGNAQALRDAVRDFAREVAPVQGPPLELSVLGAFVALRPSGVAQDIDRLAATVVDRFDRFRAPLSGEDRRRRESVGLTPNQAALLERWGYPYVFEEFRFHMTLSDALEPAERNRLIEALGPVVAPLCREPLVIDAVTLVHQPDRESRFAPVERASLRKR